MTTENTIQAKRLKFLKNIAEDYVYTIGERLPFDLSRYDLTTEEIETVERLKDRIFLMVEADIAYDDAKARGEVQSYEDFDFARFGLTPDEIEEMKSLYKPFDIIRERASEIWRNR